MKKEKKVRTYQRRTKSGKMVTVKAHTAKYDAAEHAKELAKKKGAGEELEERKKKKTPQLELPFDKDSKEEIVEEVKEIAKKGVEKSTKKSSEGKSTKEAKSNAKTKTESKSKKAETSEPAFTAAEFKEWYQGTGSAADKKVAKALRAQLGRSGYKKLEDEAIDNYSARGHLSMFKRVSSGGGVTESPKSSRGFNNEVSFSKNFPKELRKFLDPKNHSLEKKPTKAVEAAFKKAGFGITYNSVEGLWEPTMGGKVYGEVDYASKIKAERSKKPEVVRWAKENGYVVSRDGTYHLRADSRKSSYDVHTLSEMEKIMKSKSSKDSKAKLTMVRVGTDSKRVEEVKKQMAEADKRDKAFLALPKPEKGSKGYATHMALRSYVRQGGFGDDSMRDALVRHGYPKETAYSKGIAEVIALGRKHGVIPERKSSKQKAKTKKSYTTAKRMKPSEVADMTTKRDWVYSD